MLNRTFLHLPGIGKVHDAKLKACGLLCWEDALAAHTLPFKKSVLCAGLISGLIESQQRLQDEDALWFSERLPVSEQWRLFPHFHHRAAYLDIETTGLSYPNGSITSIALYDGTDLKVYVQGRNLEDFMSDIGQYELLVTWNGRAFDVPFIRKALGLRMQVAHLDLFPVFRSLGIKGGLKKVEKQLGLEREGLEGVDGYMAILLWREYLHTGRESVLETLMAYNAEDVLSLEILARYACARHDCELPAASKFHNPYHADAVLIERLKSYLPERYA